MFKTIVVTLLVIGASFFWAVKGAPFAVEAAKEDMKNSSATAFHSELVAMGYDLPVSEVKKLVGFESPFLNKGADGPTETVTFDNGERHKVFIRLLPNVALPELWDAETNAILVLNKDSNKAW